MEEITDRTHFNPTEFAQKNTLSPIAYRGFRVETPPILSDPYKTFEAKERLRPYISSEIVIVALRNGSWSLARFMSDSRRNPPQWQLVALDEEINEYWQDWDHAYFFKYGWHTPFLTKAIEQELCEDNTNGVCEYCRGFEVTHWMRIIPPTQQTR